MKIEPTTGANDQYAIKLATDDNGGWFAQVDDWRDGNRSTCWTSTFDNQHEAIKAAFVKLMVCY